MRLSVNAKIMTGFVLAAASVIIVSILAVMSTLRAVDSSRLVAHTHQVLAELQSVRSATTQAESASRIYLLEPREAYLTAYSRALDDSRVRIDRIRNLTSDNPFQQALVDSLTQAIGSASESMGAVIAARDAQGLDAARRLLGGEAAAAGMSRIEDVIGRMEGHENLLLIRRAEEREKSTTDTIINFSALAFLILCSFTLVSVLIRRDLAKRREDEKALIESGILLDSIVDEVPAMIFMKDAATLRFVRFNKAGEELTGFSRTELIGKNDYDFFPKDEADFFTAKDREVLKDKKLLDIPEEPIQTRHRGVRILHTRKISLLNDAGEPQYLLGVSEDITEHRHAEDALRKAQADLEARIENRTAELKRANEALQRSEAHYRLLFESNPLPMWVYDLETLSFLAVNNAAVQRYGYSRDEFLSMTIRDIRPAEEVPKLLQNLASTTTKFESTYDWRHRKKDGTIIEVEITSDQIVFAGRVARLVLAHDITERKRGEEARARIAALVESSDDAIMTKTLDGIITDWNHAAERMFGYAAAEAIGKPMLLIIPEDRAAEEPQILSQVGRGEPISHYETVRIRKDGTRINTSVGVSPIRDASGRIIGASTIVRDITERVTMAQELEKLYTEARKLNEELERRVEERTIQLEVANKELEAFSYSVSHDLRAPLRSIDGFSQAILDEYGGKLDGKGTEFLQRVRTAAQRMAQLIDDLLNLSRVSRAEMHVETADLSAMVLAIFDELQRLDPSRRVDLRIAPGIIARGDGRLLYVVMHNLLDNAWKYTAKHERARIEFGVVKDAPKTIYFVRDDGAGFDMAYADKLFGAFQRLHRTVDFPGTGIGLATVQRIVHRHGGRVWAEGAVEKGATFFFTLS